MQTKQNIRIVPIFDQMASPKIWHDFTRLEMLCDTVICGYSVDNTDKERIMNSHKYNWTHEIRNFAFAAYDGNIMVGFANGFKEDNSEVCLRNLYVNPSYNGMGIGKELLKQSERVGALLADKMSVVALKNSVGFYEYCGYDNPNNRCMSKKLPRHMVGVVPVFKTLHGLHAKKKVDYDKKLVKQCEHQPMFVYVTYTGEIDAVAVRTPSKDVHVWTNQNKRGMAEFYEKLLLMAMSKVK